MKKESPQSKYKSGTEKSEVFSQNKILNEDYLIERNLTTSTIKYKKQYQKVSPFVLSMKGAFETKINIDYKDELVQALSNKYL